MKYLEQFSLKRVFDFSYVVDITGNVDLASGIIQNYLSKDYIKRVKKNLYVATSLETGGSIPSKFEIASNITNSSFISYHSAFEFYGYQNQVYNEIYVSSLEQFRPFDFEHNKYVCKRVKDESFVNTVNGVRISTIEKTIVDSIDSIKSFDDFEELFEVLSIIPLIDGSKILTYLEHVNKRILFSKTGLILSFYKDGYNITKYHLDEMKKNGVNKASYFTSEKHRLNKYYNEWKLHSYDISMIKVD
ncbi:MAG: hypothetical protein GX149_01300 [Acholeplasmataceae bacterium]|nr:hypothetical protein [Acholeplasmataceae bacterium]